MGALCVLRRALFWVLYNVNISTGQIWDDRRRNIFDIMGYPFQFALCCSYKTF